MNTPLVNLSSYIFGASSQTQVTVDARNSPNTSGSAGISTIVQLSSYGQTLASLEDLRSNAQGFKNLSRPPTFKDFQVVVQGFVQSLNSFSKNVSLLSSKQDLLKQDPLDPGSRSSQALDNVRKTVADSSEFASLNKIGISQQAGGTFSINQKQLGKSFLDNRTDTLTRFSNFADHVTQEIGKQTFALGFIGKKMNDFKVSFNELENVSSAAQRYMGTLKKSSPFVAAQVPTATSYTAKHAMFTYSNVASL